jgi:hypothetical protein
MPPAASKCAHAKSKLAACRADEARNARTDHDGIEIQKP